MATRRAIWAILSFCAVALILLESHLGASNGPTASISIDTSTRTITYSVSAADPDFAGAVKLILQFYNPNNSTWANYDGVDVSQGSSVSKTYGAFGPGPQGTLGSYYHYVKVVAVNVTSSGVFESYVAVTNGGPYTLTESGQGQCNGLDYPNAWTWCLGDANYYQNRQLQTRMAYSNHVQVGVSDRLGGAIMQLYGQKRNFNFVDESPGAAIQQDYWAGCAQNCDSIPHAVPYAGYMCDDGTFPYYEWYGDAILEDTWRQRMNPIQARSSGCTWVNWVNGTSSGSYSLSTAHEYFRYSDYFSINLEQWVTVDDDHVTIIYKASNVGSSALTTDWKNMPAIFLSSSMNYKVYVSGHSDWGWQYPSSGSAARLRFTGDSSFNTTDPEWDGKWISSCSSADPNDPELCVTIAPKDMSPRRVTHAYITRLLGYANMNQITLGNYQQFNTGTANDRYQTVWIFPYRWDYTVPGKNQTVAQRIDALRQ